MNHNKPPAFADYEQGPDFDRARSQIATPFLQLEIDLTTATINQIFEVSGDFLYCDPDPGGVLASGGAASIAGVAVLELNNQYSDKEAAFYVQPGFAINALFKRLKLSWPAQPGKKLKLLYSTGSLVVPTNTGNITGSVSVIDGGLARSLLNQAGLGTASLNAVAANCAHSQLWNPAGSGKNLYLESMIIGADVAGPIGVGFYTSALTTAFSAGTSKLSSGGALVGLLKGQSIAAPTYTVSLFSMLVQANQSQIINFREPVIVTPGSGVNVWHSTVNTSLRTSYEWFEQ